MPHEQLSLVCASCEIVFSIPASRAVSIYGPRLFCSRRCQQLAQTHERVTNFCLYCEAPILVRPNAAKKGRGRYCSRSCGLRDRTYPSLEERFWAKVAKQGPDQCWEWQGACGEFGGGIFRLGPQQGHAPAHRFAYESTYGLVFPGICVCHRCDNPPCCNPAHLFLGTQGDNMRDARDKGRTLSGEKSVHAKLTEEQVRAIYALKGILSEKQIALQFDISVGVISNIWNGWTWQHLHLHDSLEGKFHYRSRKAVA